MEPQHVVSVLTCVSEPLIDRPFTALSALPRLAWAESLTLRKPPRSLNFGSPRVPRAPKGAAGRTELIFKGGKPWFILCLFRLFQSPQPC